MAERTLQRNNGSPRGMGQPNRRPNIKTDVADIIMRPEDREIFGSSANPAPYKVDGPPPGQVSVNDNLAKGGVNPEGFPEDPTKKQPTSIYAGATGGATQPGARPGLATGDASRGAMAQYGTGNIAGVGGIQTGQFMHQLEGFNTQGWGTGERGTESIKNAVGRMMSQIDVTQPGARDRLMALPEFKQLFPMAKAVNHANADQIDFGDGNGPVDVIRAAVAGGSGAAWQWGANSAGAPQAGGPQGGPQGSGTQIYNGAPVFQRSPNQLTPVPSPMDATGQNPYQTNNAEDFLQWLLMQQQPLV